MVDTPTENAGKPKSDQTSSGMMKPGDVIIDQIYLNTVTGVTLDLKPFFVELNIFEDMFSPTLHGSIVIRDSINLIGTVPIIGDEVLTISVRTPFQEVPAQDDYFNKIHKSFVVYSVKDRKLNNDREQYYQLFFCSVEAAKDNVSRISQKYTGTTDEIVDSIFTEYLALPRLLTDENVSFDPKGEGNTPLFISDTPHQSMITFVPPMWSPIHCINWLAARSIGAKNPSPTYLFFESTKAFYYCSVESLITEQIDSNSIFCDYVYHPNLSNLTTTSGLSRGYSTVEAVKFLTNLDVIQGQDLGHFASTVHNFDIVKKEYTAFTYDHGFNFNQFNHMEDYKLAVNDQKTENTFSVDKDKKYNMIFPINIMRSGDSKRFVATVNPGVLDSTEDSVDLHPETFVAQRNSALMDLTTMRLQLTVSGRTDIEIGKIIKFYYPSVGEKPKETAEPFVWDLLISGLYMITAIHHQITSLQHKMFVEIAKDSYSFPLYDVTEETS